MLWSLSPLAAASLSAAATATTPASPATATTLASPTLRRRRPTKARGRPSTGHCHALVELHFVIGEVLIKILTALCEHGHELFARQADGLQQLVHVPESVQLLLCSISEFRKDCIGD